MIHAPAQIKEYLLAGEYVLILVDPKELESDRNLFGYNLQGQICWRIADSPKLHRENYFTGIYLRENNLPYAYCKNGIELLLDEATGAVIKSELIK